MRYLLAIIISFCTLGAARAETISVSAAISLREALEEIGTAYKADTGDEVKFNFGASGQLASQIINGAPVDLFISAANKQMDDLAKAKLLVDGSRRVIAGNTLVLVVPADAKDPPRSFGHLADAKVRRIAIGEPKTVPAGQYAMQLLKSLNLMDAVADRLVHGANVRQVLSYVERGEVDAGIVYSTDARLSGEKVRVMAKAESSAHEPVEYPAAVIADSKKRDAAARFLKYLQKAPAVKILESHGFASPSSSKEQNKP